MKFVSKYIYIARILLNKILTLVLLLLTVDLVEIEVDLILEEVVEVEVELVVDSLAVDAEVEII
jgi:hypothetical protein